MQAARARKGPRGERTQRSPAQASLREAMARFSPRPACRVLAVVASLALLGCSRAPVSAPTAVAEAGEWRFDVTGDAAANELTVEAWFPPGTPSTLDVESGSERFVSEARLATKNGWRDLSVSADGVRAPECAADGCRIRYRFRLGEAARTVNDVDTAAATGGAIEAPPSTWLLHPNDATPRAYRLHVAPALPFLSPLPRSADGAYEVRGSGLDVAPFAGLGGAWTTRTTTVGGATLTIGIAPGSHALDDDAIVTWIAQAAEGVAAYYGRFPAKSPLFLVIPGRGTSIDGKTLGGGGESIVFGLGSAVTPAIARESWVATHEMIHMNFPSFGYPHSWLEEGIATYVEPIIRARAGIIAPESMWHDLLDQGPQGLAQAGDEGLERTHTWGRTYWGGALFCLVADVTIRERTKNARSFDDVLRAVVASGATVANDWDIARLLDVGDAATGVPVLHELHARLALAPGAIDLPGLWKQLGVSLHGASVTYDDRAPLADIRRAITARPPTLR